MCTGFESRAKFYYFTRLVVSLADTAQAWQSVSHNLDAMDVGGFLTEFGAVGDDDDSTTLIHLQVSVQHAFSVHLGAPVISAIPVFTG